MNSEFPFLNQSFLLLFFFFFFLKEITLPSIFHRIWQHISQILHPFRLLLLRTPQQSLQHAFFFFFFFFSIKMKKWTDFPQTLSPILIIFTPPFQCSNSKWTPSNPLPPAAPSSIYHSILMKSTPPKISKSTSILRCNPFALLTIPSNLSI